jgi:predicted  nucleic acid-binding Zn-ribbon protein
MARFYTLLKWSAYVLLIGAVGAAMSNQQSRVSDIENRLNWALSELSDVRQKAEEAASTAEDAKSSAEDAEQEIDDVRGNLPASMQ